MKLHHIGVAVKKLEEGIKLWEGVFGFRVKEIKESKEEGIKVGILEGNGIIIELLTPISSHNPVAKFINTRGEGVHHLCFEVKDIKKTLKTIEQKGVKLIDKIPRKGIIEENIAFLHPSSTCKVLIELCEGKTNSSISSP